ncbi:hypothetical protein MMC07_007539, partial [Pseudocyphellaria aurata]|nr:hypothetical protein [Pseudocyphellaria aurata]
SFSNVTNTGSYDWAVGDVVDGNNKFSTVITDKMDISNKSFYFYISKPENWSIGFSSVWFTIAPNVSSSTSATTTSASMSSSSASDSSFILSNSPASSATTSVPPSPTATVTIYALSQRAKTGIWVGIGLGIPLLFALGIYLGWRFRGGRNTPGGSRASIVDTPFIDPQLNDPPGIVEAPNSIWPPELPDSNHPMAHEMPDQPSR